MGRNLFYLFFLNFSNFLQNIFKFIHTKVQITEQNEDTLVLAAIHLIERGEKLQSPSCIHFADQLAKIHRNFEDRRLELAYAILLKFRLLRKFRGRVEDVMTEDNLELYQVFFRQKISTKKKKKKKRKKKKEKEKKQKKERKKEGEGSCTRFAEVKVACKIRKYFLRTNNASTFLKKSTPKKR
jgi:hypothetical protein